MSAEDGKAERHEFKGLYLFAPYDGSVCASGCGKPKDDAVHQAPPATKAGQTGEGRPDHGFLPPIGSQGAEFEDSEPCDWEECTLTYGEHRRLYREPAPDTAAERAHWREEARRYAENADYWRAERDRLAARVGELEAALERQMRNLAEAATGWSGAEDEQAALKAEVERLEREHHDETCARIDMHNERLKELGETRAWLATAEAEVGRLVEALDHYDVELASLRTSNLELEEKLARALATRPEYDIRCQDCGRPHDVDTSIPSDIWNKIAKPEDALCTRCIDARLKAVNLQTDNAEFYYVGAGLRSRLYGETSNGHYEAVLRELREANRELADELNNLRSHHSECRGPWCALPKEPDGMTSKYEALEAANRELVGALEAAEMEMRGLAERMDENMRYEPRHRVGILYEAADAARAAIAKAKGGGQ